MVAENICNESNINVYKSMLKLFFFIKFSFWCFTHFVSLSSGGTLINQCCCIQIKICKFYQIMKKRKEKVFQHSTIFNLVVRIWTRFWRQKKPCALRTSKHKNREVQNFCYPFEIHTAQNRVVQGPPVVYCCYINSF